LHKFPKRAYCIQCKSYHVYRKNKRYFCKKCRYQFNLTTKIKLAKLRISLREWYEIINCFALGLSANKAYKFLQTNSYRTVFKAYQIIREKIVSDSEINFEKWKGTFEVNESFYGGRFINKRKAVRMELRKRIG